MGGTPVQQVPGPYEDTTCQMVVAYGEGHPHLETVRAFRDDVLTRSSAGRQLIDLYYATAPFLASLAGRNRATRLLARALFAYPSYLVSRAVLRIRD